MTIMKQHPTPPISSLEELRQQKNEALTRLREQKLVMAAAARKLVAPLQPAATRGHSLLRLFNNGMALADGLLTGFKLMRRIRRLFR